MKFVRTAAICATLLCCISPLGLCYRVDQSEVKLHLKHVRRDADSGDFNVHINANDKEHKLQLKKVQADLSAHSDVKVVFANTDVAGNLVLNEWSPSQEELEAAHDFYIDEKSNAALRIQEKDGEYALNGVFAGFAVEHDGVDHTASIIRTPRNDMRIIPKKNQSTAESESSISEPLVFAGETPNVVELMIYCDMELGESFGFNRQRILDYWTVFMWDVNLRFKTLESVKVSFKTTSVIISESKRAQGYLENARDPNTGLAEHGRILNEWKKWAPQQSKLPKYDMVILVSKTDMEWGGGLSWVGGVCNNGGYNVASWNEYGTWSSVSVGAHEMGHNMGADHDEYVNGSCRGHIYHGYIMDGSDEDRRFFFSACSDKDITRNVNSKDKDCLRNLAVSGAPALRENYDSLLAPSFDAQCRQQSGDGRAKYRNKATNNNCKRIVCEKADGGTFDVQPLDNSPCNPNSPEARCFRGNCREKGQIFKNVGSGLCMLSTNPFSFGGSNKFVKCPGYSSPLERLVVRSDNREGITLASPYEQGDDTKETGDKCMYAGGSDAPVIGTWNDRCGDYGNPWHRWDFVDVGNGEFLIKHRITGRCLRPFDIIDGSDVAADNNCQVSNKNMRFIRYY